MATSRKVAVGIGIASVVLIGVRVGISFLSQPSDETLIRDALQQSLEASKSGEPGSLLEMLSSKLTVNSESQSGGSRQVADFIRKAKPDIIFAEVSPHIRGDSATMTADAKVKFGLLGANQTFDIPKVQISFQRESATTLLIVPTRKWRIIDVQFDSSLLPTSLFGL